MAWTEEAQNWLIVAPGRWSKPASTETTRAMLEPCWAEGFGAAPGRSSIRDGSSSGTLPGCRADHATERSPGRTSLRKPLNARPIGVRAVETITARSLGVLPRRGCARVKRALSHRRSYAVGAGLWCGLGLARDIAGDVTGRSPPRAPVARRPLGFLWGAGSPRGAVRTVGGAGAAAWPAPARTTRVTGDLGSADLGAGSSTACSAATATGPMPSPRRRSGSRSSNGSALLAPSAAYARQQGSGAIAHSPRGGVKRSLPNSSCGRS